MPLWRRRKAAVEEGPTAPDFAVRYFSLPDPRRVHRSGQGFLLVGDDGEPVQDWDDGGWYAEDLDVYVIEVNVGVATRQRDLQDEGFTPGRFLTLVRDPLNRHDANAIVVADAEQSKKIGYLGRDAAAELAPMLDAGRVLEALSMWEWREDGRRTRLWVMVGEAIGRRMRVLQGAPRTFDDVTEPEPTEERVAEPVASRERAAVTVSVDEPAPAVVPQPHPPAPAPGPEPAPASRRRRPAIHVVPGEKGWLVTREGDDEPVSLHRTQAEAKLAGGSVAQRDFTELVVHGRDGAERTRTDYGPPPPDLVD